jgi:hypothetical protein
MTAKGGLRVSPAGQFCWESYRLNPVQTMPSPYSYHLLSFPRSVFLWTDLKSAYFALITTADTTTCARIQSGPVLAAATVETSKAGVSQELWSVWNGLSAIGLLVWIRNFILGIRRNCRKAWILSSWFSCRYCTSQEEWKGYRELGLVAVWVGSLWYLAARFSPLRWKFCFQSLHSQNVGNGEPEGNLCCSSI